MAQEFCNDFRPPGIPELEYSPMEYRGSYIDHLDPFEIESGQQTVRPGLEDGTHPVSGGLVNGPDSDQSCGFGEVHTISPSEGAWVLSVRPFAGQATSCQASSGIEPCVEAWVESPSHVPGRGKYGMYGIGERGEEIALSNGEMNRAE